MGRQRDRLQLCDSHIWNPAMLANAPGIKPTLGPAFVWPSTPTDNSYVSLFSVSSHPGALKHAVNTTWTLSPYSSFTIDFHTQLSGLPSYMSSLHQAFHDHLLTDIIFLAECPSVLPKWKLQDTTSLVLFSLLYPWERAHSRRSTSVSVSWVKNKY